MKKESILNLDNINSGKFSNTAAVIAVQKGKIVLE